MSLRMLCRPALVLGILFLTVPGRAEQAAPPDKALLVVRLPAAATLTIGSSPTRQEGSERQFLSPPLESGKKYRYELTATWEEKGQARREVRQAVVRAGEKTVVDFNAPSEPAVKSRKFRFTYAAVVTGLEPGQRARVWVPVPPSNDEQDVRVVSQELPAEGKIDTEPKSGNRMLYVEAKAGAGGEVSLKVVYEVTRRELKGEGGKELAEDMDVLARYLKADALVPVAGEPLEKIKNKLIQGKELPGDEIAAARVFYDAVNGHMRYSKEGKEGKDWGRGDSLWACDSGFGNCSDFHSLFISLARSRKIPAKFEIGFPLPAKRGEGEIAGYHCWAKFRPAGKGWVPVDISEANKNPKMTDYYFGNLTEDRVMFSTGRDLDLVPRQDDGPLKFFIYPYVEVEGKAYPQDKIRRTFSFRDE
jgi:uncharacterized protein (TIGR03000 family)